MNEKDYCKIVFLGLINLLSFLFSIIFFISSSSIKSKEEIERDIFNCSEEMGNLIDNHYKGNLALFVLQVFCFAFFFIFLMAYFYFNEKDENEARIIRYQSINPSTEIRNDSERNINSKQSCMMKAMIVVFIFCQAFYAIKLILVPVIYYKININPNNECKNIILKNIRDIIIVGFIFFVIIFLPIYIILLVLFFKNKDFSSIIFCNCFTHNITNFCIFLSNCSKKCHTNEVLRSKNEEREKQIKDLTIYRDDLKLMNENWIKGIVPNKDELSKLNLGKN
jgi:hypothetical protein